MTLNLNCAHMVGDTLRATQEGSNVVLRIDRAAYVVLDVASLTQLRDYINLRLGTNATAAVDDGFNMYYVIGTHVRNSERTLCKTDADAIRHAQTLLSRKNGFGSDETKLCVVKVERAAPPVVVRKPVSTDV